MSYGTVEIAPGKTMTEVFWLTEARGWRWSQWKSRLIHQIPHPSLKGAMRTAEYLLKVPKEAWYVYDMSTSNQVLATYKTRGLRATWYVIYVGYHDDAPEGAM